MKIQSQTLLDEVRKMTEDIIAIVEGDFSKLTPEQLNQRPGEGKWSIAECLEHMNRYGDYYVPAIGDAISAAKDSSPSPSFKPGWFGNYSAQSMLPKEGKVTNAMNTFKDMNPSLSQVEDGVLEKFLRQQTSILRLISFSEQVNLNKVRVPITISRFIRFKLGDMLRFLVYHNHRHIIQAKKVREGL
jgi:hypothetical protein